MKLSDFYYDLPKELIAQEPLDERDASRLMALNRKENSVTEKVFRDIVDIFRPGDCLVVNDTRVVPARLYGRRKTGARVEIFILDFSTETFKALIRPSRRIKNGETIELDNGVHATVSGPADSGRFVEFDAPLDKVLEGGHMPLPPYIARNDREKDRQYYQTVYSRKEGATASPTAGLHFTRKLLRSLDEKGVSIVYVTLHTSYGTFAPVKVENIKDHKMHFEQYEIDEEAVGQINNAKSSAGRVFAVGTTSTRVLESAAARGGKVAPSSGDTDLFIYPGYKFRVVDGIITNFHLPESTLLMLVCAFAGRDLIFEAYRTAIEKKFRFFSYGDAMVIF